MRQRDRQTDGQTDSHSTMAYPAFYPSAISVNENITGRPACTLHRPTVIVDKPKGGVVIFIASRVKDLIYRCSKTPRAQ